MFGNENTVAHSFVLTVMKSPAAALRCSVSPEQRRDWLFPAERCRCSHTLNTQATHTLHLHDVKEQKNRRP